MMMQRLLRPSRRLAAAGAAAAAAAYSGPSSVVQCIIADPSQALTDAEWYNQQDAHIKLNLPLVEEARQGWWHEVTRRLRLGESVLSRGSSDGSTLLHLAALSGRRKLCEELLVEHGAQALAHERDHKGRTPLHRCAERGSHDVAATLAAHDSAFDANEADATGATALSIASRLGHVRLVRWLVSRADLRPMEVDRYGVTALHKAVSFGQTQCVEALISDKRVRSAIDQPVGRPTVPDSYEALSGGESALILASKHHYYFNHTQHTRIARLLLAAGADPNTIAANGQTAVHGAAAAGNVKILQELVSCGRVASGTWLLRDRSGKTPLDLAKGNDARAIILPATRKAEASN